MMSDWKLLKLSDIAEFNPRESLAKGTVAKKIAMDKLQPFTRDVPEYELESYSGGTKFRNGDTIMARITPCLENGKTSKVTILDENEVGFGSTEFIVFRAKDNVDADYLYYLICSSLVREPAIKSMVGSSGRQRVQTDVVQNLELYIPDTNTQIKIGKLLKDIDDKILCNKKTNQNLQEQAFALFDRLISQTSGEMSTLDQIAELNPKRQLSKGTVARYIDMSQLSTTGAFPAGWEMKPFNGGMRFANGDTILARITPCLENGKTAYIDFLDNSEIAFGSTEYVVISTKGVYPSEFFYCLARYPSFVEYAVKNMNGSSGRQRVSADIIGKYQLPSLKRDEIETFKETVPALFRVMKTNSLEIKKLSELRDTLLPKLMSGELDVSEIES